MIMLILQVCTKLCN